MIHVSFGLHDADGKYSKFIGVTMASIFENTSSPVTIHIIHDATLTDDNREKFSELATKYNRQVEFHNAEELCPEEITFITEKLADKIKSRFSIGAFYRLLIKKIFNTGRMIYLDADIIVNLDIAELWEQDLQNYPVAAVPEVEAALNRMIKDKFLLHSGIVKTDNYFCSGVMIFDLDRIGENFFRDGVQFLADNPKCESVDQDILNAFFSENYFKLAQRFDSFVFCDRFWELSVEPKIYHYAGHSIGLDLNDEYNRLWLENFARTAWFNVEIFGRLSAEIRKRNTTNLFITQNLARISAEHRRAFFLSPNDIPKLKKLFSFQDDEPIIEIRNANSLNELILKMDELRGQKLFFIFYPDWKLIRKFLTHLGFKELEDFVAGEIFLVQEQGGKPLFEYNFVRNL